MSAPIVLFNLEQLDVSRAEADALVAAGMIYDPHAGDPCSETAEGTIYYPETDDLDGLDLVESWLADRRR